MGDGLRDIHNRFAVKFYKSNYFNQRLMVLVNLMSNLIGCARVEQLCS